MHGTCMKCGKAVLTVKIQTITASTPPPVRKFNAVTYNCSSCNAVLSVGLDPLALKADRVREVVKALKQ